MSCDSGPRLLTVDLDGDGTPELQLQCTNGNHGVTADVFFKWAANSLLPLNPRHRRRAEGWTALEDATPMDIDGSGVFSVLTPVVTSPSPGSTDDDRQWNVYRLIDGKLQATHVTIPYTGRFIRDTAAPHAVVEQFSAAPAGSYILRVINGERGHDMVSSATVTLNGATVVSPELFSQNSRVITTDVTLAAKNTISVELKSAPGAFVDVVLLPRLTP
jgi:hypothetical protein